MARHAVLFVALALLATVAFAEDEAAIPNVNIPDANEVAALASGGGADAPAAAKAITEALVGGPLSSEPLDAAAAGPPASGAADIKVPAAAGGAVAAVVAAVSLFF